MNRDLLANDAERSLWDGFAGGDVVDLGHGDPDEERFDLLQWGDERIVRAEVINSLLLGVQPAERGRVAKIRLAGAHIVGQLNVSRGVVTCELELERCSLDETPDFANARTQSVAFIACHLAGFAAYRWESSGSADFGGSRIDGEVGVEGARIGGKLSMIDTTLTNPGGAALDAKFLSVEQGMFCCGAFTAIGAVDLYGAKIGGGLIFDNATLTNPDGFALHGYQLTVEQGIHCRNGFTATGTIDLIGAHVGGRIIISEATLTNPGGIAVRAYDCTIEHDMSLWDVTVTGAIELHRATISGGLVLVNATVLNPGGVVLDARGVTASRLDAAEGLTATGTITVRGATIGRVSFADATLTLGPDQRLALDCGTLTTRKLLLPSDIPGEVDLGQANIGVLDIPPRALTAPMRLSGLAYLDLDPEPEPALRQRLAWLRNDPDGYHPQPYEQLAAYYRANGQDRDGRLVLLAKRRAQRRNTPNGFGHLPVPLRHIRRLPGWILDSLAGYGYVPARAFAWLVAAIATGTWLLYSYSPLTPTSNRFTNSFLLALDSIIPTSPFGLRSTANLAGAGFVTAMCLQILGYALSVALLPAITRALARGDR